MTPTRGPPTIRTPLKIKSRKLFDAPAIQNARNTLQYFSFPSLPRLACTCYSDLGGLDALSPLEAAGQLGSKVRVATARAGCDCMAQSAGSCCAHCLLAATTSLRHRPITELCDSVADVPDAYTRNFASRFNLHPKASSSTRESRCRFPRHFLRASGG